MEDIIISCRIIAIRPFFDGYGNEFVCIEFGTEAAKPPSVVSMPSNIPKEISSIMPLLAQIPKMHGQRKIFDNRLVLYLTKEEWGRLSRKYQYNDEVEIKINKEGDIHLIPIK